ncbi:MAG: DUF3817 domain-containing protein [Devosiaceae bacterium]|nr:DUF3817 domain-containing protein [Devosiaceae bacterium MH13]
MIELLKSPTGRLRMLGWMEGTTLITLLGIAVPLKHLAERPELVSIVGPLHGLTFIAYIALASSTVFGGGWSGREIARVLGASIVPFGTFLNERLLKQKQEELAHV